MSAIPSTIQLIQAYQVNDESAATKLYEQYADRLVRYARRQIGTVLQSVISPDDVVQATFEVFFRQVRKKRYQFDHAGAVWRLLRTIALNRVRHFGSKPSPVSLNVETQHLPILHDRSHSEDIELSDEIESLLRGLPTRSREILNLGLQGYAVFEIAWILDCTRWTIRRHLDRIGQRLERRMQLS